MDKRHSAAQWDWTPDIWEWTPEHGRWSPRYGQPRDCVFLTLSTDALRPRDAYDYWRETVFYGFEADVPDNTQRRGFLARSAALIAPRGNLYWYTSDPVSGYRARRHCLADDEERLDLGLVLAGERHHQQTGDRPLRAGPGELFAYDSARPSQVAWNAHSGLHLSLDRQAVRQALGSDLPAPSKLIPALQHHPLFPFLRDQLQLMAKHGAKLNRSQQALVLDHIIELTFSALNAIGGAPEQNPPSLLFAARQFIHRHLADPNLDTEQLARQLGCSRATLYRAFAEHDLTVAGYLREARLRRVHRLLARAPDQWSIADIAARCGFLDSASFSRLFRQRFGVRPRDLRQRHQSR
ncbi:AraC family transcriptional regulator [Alcanivorax xiamenensis]|uniref:AraC family transcriptional regulator n=1 Tax=Alcanivorax xiamenensis TaxID=1177156 RepID=A0ABQ6YD87_9GAMM|nr:helix-turn-helix domain-containing protein [Alcanivorax xiamenensis]KAF0808292.1 AraC family transcriptional regulator [Alcanivorax xiamenensis]